MRLNEDDQMLAGAAPEDVEAIGRALADALQVGTRMAARDVSDRAAYASAEVADYWADRDPIRFDPAIGGPVAGRLRGLLVAAPASAWETAHSAFERRIGPPRKFARNDTLGAEAADRLWVERTVLSILDGVFAEGLEHPDAARRGVAASMEGPFRRTR